MKNKTLDKSQIVRFGDRDYVTLELKDSMYLLITQEVLVFMMVFERHNDDSTRYSERYDVNRTIYYWANTLTM